MRQQVNNERYVMDMSDNEDLEEFPLDNQDDEDLEEMLREFLVPARSH
jgi:hypothetical protein